MKIADLLDVSVPSVAELAHKYKTTTAAVNAELARGEKVEQEHTSDPKVARRIALAHLGERLDYYQQLAKIDEVKIDNIRGWGNVPDNQNVDYLGLKVFMRPSMFLKLATPLNRSDAQSADKIKQHLSQDGAIASAWLVISIPEAWEQSDFSKPAQVVGHEGRNRMIAIQELEGDAPVETHLFFAQGLRARHITPEWMHHLNQHMLSQVNKSLVTGPLFQTSVTEDTTRTTKSGAPGTLKAKISRLYGGSVTCDKVQRLKTRKGATAHDKAQANWYQNMNCGGATRVDESKQVSVPDWPTNLAWKIQFKRFQGMDPLLDERANKIYLMPFQNWKGTYYSLTNKDWNKVKNMPTEVYKVDSSVLVGDMYIINQALRSGDKQERERLLKHYKTTMVTYDQFIKNPLMFKMPEILATPEQISNQHAKVTMVWDPVIKQINLGVIDKSTPKGAQLTEIFREPAQHMNWETYGSGENLTHMTHFKFLNHHITVEMAPDVRQVGAKYVFGKRDQDLPEHHVGYWAGFQVDNMTDLTGKLGAQASKLLAKVVSVMKGFLQTHAWDYVLFTGEEGSRDKLYQAMSEKLAAQIGAQVHTYGSDFVIHKPHMQETAGVGLVIPGVNMPADQHADEIRRQARKFGFKVSAQGVPPKARTDGKY